MLNNYPFWKYLYKDSIWYFRNNVNLSFLQILNKLSNILLLKRKRSVHCISRLILKIVKSIEKIECFMSECVVTLEEAYSQRSSLDRATWWSSGLTARHTARWPQGQGLPLLSRQHPQVCKSRVFHIFQLTKKYNSKANEGVIKWCHQPFILMVL